LLCANDREYKQGVDRDVAGEVASPAQLELHLACTFAVLRAGVRLADGDLGSRKARKLLKLLAVERARLVPLI
jgi:hypothetical protein